jgi:hypothetical protein
MTAPEAARRLRRPRRQHEMPLDWDSPVAFDARLQRSLADWLVHVKERRDRSRDDADTEADPAQFDGEDIEAFRAYAQEHLGVELTGELDEVLDNAVGFTAWTSPV